MPQVLPEGNSLAIPFVGKYCPQIVYPETPPIHDCGMDVYRTRYLRFRQLAGHRGGISDAARRLGKGQGHVSNFGGEKPTKNIGEKIAREIEAAYGKPPGWLDGLNDSALPTDGTVPEKTLLHNLHVDRGWAGQAEDWVTFEEARFGQYQPERRAERLIELYLTIEADGGRLSPEHAEAIIQRGAENATEATRKKRRGSAPI